MIKVGSKVILRKNERDHSPKMEEYFGKTATVTTKSGCHGDFRVDLDHGDWVWPHDCEEVREVPASEPHKVDSTTNPKDLIGCTKVSISKFPVIGTVLGAMAMMDGAAKYGPYNWRDKSVRAEIYVDAAMRHLMAWQEGQEVADDSKVHHLGHVIACCAILLDAQANGNLIDDRPKNKGFLPGLMEKLSVVIKEKKAGVH